MEGNMLKHGTGLLLKQKRRKLWHKIVGILACLVVFCTSCLNFAGDYDGKDGVLRKRGTSA